MHRGGKSKDGKQTAQKMFTIDPPGTYNKSNNFSNQLIQTLQPKNAGVQRYDASSPTGVKSPAAGPLSEITSQTSNKALFKRRRDHSK
jgi:hypothetical protein